MFYFLCRTRTRTRTSILHGRQGTKASKSYKLFYLLQLQKDPSIFRLQNSLRCMSTTSNQPSFTVSYLIDKLGFSPESALTASKYVNLKTPTKPDTVISFLEKHGFSKSQIQIMVKKEPRLLASNVDKTILPKLEFLHYKGFSSPDLAKVLSNCPHVLHRSLERQIIPFFNAYSNLVHSDAKTVKAIKSYRFLITYDINIINAHLLPNINILRDHGVPESNIIKMLHQFPSGLLTSPVRLKEVMEKVEDIGLLDPLVVKFVHAICVLARMRKSTLERKFDVYKKWGWSDKQIWECFRKYPSCLTVSDDRIMANMDFLVNKMGIDSSCVANQPSVLRHSLEKKIAPRGLIAQHLLSNGLIKDLKLSALFDTTENQFLKSFVTCYATKVPELLELYRENMKKESLFQGGLGTVVLDLPIWLKLET